MTATSLAGIPADPAADATPALTPKQEAFARHYAASGNGAAAARAAGYAPDSAKQTAHDLLQHPAVADRVAALEDAHGRTLRGEVAVLLDRLDTAVDLALQAGDYRAILDIVRLQAQVAALAGPEAAQRRALLYEGAGGPGPLARSRDCLDPHAAIDADAHAAAAPARAAAEIAADEAEAAAPAGRRGNGADTEGRPEDAAAAEAELAEIAAEIAELEAELGVEPQGADPDFSLPPAGALPRTGEEAPSATARQALLASTAAVRAPEPARRAA